MSSAIGEYIHLTAENYVKYGVHRKGSGAAAPNAADMVNRKRAQIRQKVSRIRQGDINGAKKLEDRLNNFLDYIDRIKEGDITDRNKAVIEQAINEMLQEQFKESLGRVNMSQADVEAMMKKPVIGTIKTPAHYAGRELGYAGTVKNRLQKLKEAMEKIKREVGYLPTKTDGTGGRTLEQIEQDILQVNNLLENMQTEVYNKLTQDKMIKSGVKIKRSTEEKELINNINDLITIYSNTEAIAEQKGMLFEMLIALIPYQFYKIGYKNAEEAFEEAVELAKKAIKQNQKGKSLAVVKYNIDFFPSKMFEKGQTGSDDDKATIKLQNILETIHTSEQKIDVILDIDGTDPETQGMTISAKNYSLGETWNKGRISVSTENSLLHFLQDENQNNFVNHWLNVVAAHEKDGHKSAPYQTKINAMRSSYNNAIKYIVFYKALTGDAFGRGGSASIPEFLVINNNKAAVGQSHVKIIPVKALLNAALAKWEENRQGFFVNTSPDVFSGYLPNDRVPETKENREYVRWGTQRIATLLVHLHQVKIHAGLNMSINSLVNLTHMSAMKF